MVGWLLGSIKGIVVLDIDREVTVCTIFPGWSLHQNVWGTTSTFRCGQGRTDDDCIATLDCSKCCFGSLLIVINQAKVDNIALMLQSCLEAEGKVGLMMNVHRQNLDAVLKMLPALQTPTVSHLSDPDWVALNTIVDESLVRTIIPQLKQSGAKGIVEYPISKIID